jgi:hypothetical protein
MNKCVVGEVCLNILGKYIDCKKREVMVDFKSYLEKLSIKEAAMSFKNSASIR